MKKEQEKYKRILNGVLTWIVISCFVGIVLMVYYGLIVWNFPTDAKIMFALLFTFMLSLVGLKIINN